MNTYFWFKMSSNLQGDTFEIRGHGSGCRSWVRLRLTFRAGLLVSVLVDLFLSEWCSPRTHSAARFKPSTRLSRTVLLLGLWAQGVSRDEPRNAWRTKMHQDLVFYFYHHHERTSGSVRTCLLLTGAERWPLPLGHAFEGLLLFFLCRWMLGGLGGLLRPLLLPMLDEEELCPKASPGEWNVVPTSLVCRRVSFLTISGSPEEGDK